MSHEEQHKKLCEILSRLVDVLDCDDLSLLSHHLGIPVRDFYAPKESEIVEAIEWRDAA